MAVTAGLRHNKGETGNMGKGVLGAQKLLKLKLRCLNLYVTPKNGLTSR